MSTFDDRSTDRFDFDAWVERIPHHVDAIHARLREEQLEAARQASLERRRPFLIDQATGHTEHSQLCWVCGAVPVHHGPTLPAFRACRFCLAYDRTRASRLGLLMLLPLMDAPSQPVLEGHPYPSDPEVLAALADVWSGVSVLDAWRVSLAKVVLSMLSDVRRAAGIDLVDWQEMATVGTRKSQASWNAYVDGYFPALTKVLAESPVPEHGIVR